MKKRLHFLFLIALFALQGIRSQTFPVTLLPQTIPPAPIYFSSYADASSTNSPLRLQIILNDLSVANREIKLKAYFEGNGIAFQSKDVVIGAPSLFIEGGIPLTLTNVELAPYFTFENITGISPTAYGQVIPEGSYQFCFEVFDSLTGARISQKTCATTYIFQNEPPLLVTPYNRDDITEQNPLNLMFQWTPRHINVNNVQYELSIVEIWDQTINPQAAFLASPPFFQTTTTNTSYLYGPSDPLFLPNKRYAWRVQAKALNGAEEIGLFKNNGFSEVYWFNYVTPCDTPNNARHEVKGAQQVNILWDDFTTDVPEFIVRYREKGNNNEWFFSRTSGNWITLWDLRPGTTYEYQVNKKCLISESEYSILQTFTTLEENDETSLINCGISPDMNIENMEPLEQLLPGNMFKAGDFPVKVIEANGSNGRFSGKGYVSFPYFKNIKVAVNFTNIFVNNESQLAEGTVITVYDPSWGNILDVDEVIDVVEDIADVVTGGDNTEIPQLDYDIDTNDISITDGQIIITKPDGTQDTFDYDEGDTYTITDASGDEWTVDDKGNITQTGQGDPSPPLTSNNADGIRSGTHDGTVDDPYVDAITNDVVKVTFRTDSDTRFALDQVNNDYETSKYPKINASADQSYYPAHKAAVQGEDDVFYADIEISDAKINIDSLIIKTVENKAIKHERIAGTNTYKITVSGANPYRTEECVVTYLDPTDNKYKIAASFFVHHIKKHTEVPVQVVTVNGGNAITNFEAELNDIFGRAGGKFKVKPDVIDITIAQNSWDENNNNIIDYDGSGLLSDYPTELKNIYQEFKKQYPDYDSRQYFIFVLGKDLNVSKPLSGFMPKTRQWGFIFESHLGEGLEKKDSALKVAAHELGHGVYTLAHPFGENPDNSGQANTWLMDYGNGTELGYPNWATMSDPSLKLYLFQDDSGGEFAGSYALAPNFKFVFIRESSTLYVNPAKKKITGTLPGFIVKGKNDESDTYYNWDFTQNKYVDKDNPEKSYPVTPKNTISYDSKINLFYNLDAGCGQKGSIQLEYKDISKHFEQLTSNSLTSEQKANNVNALIANHTKTKSRPVPCSSANISNNGWFEIPIDCSSSDIKELVQPEVDKINALVTETDIEIIVKTINDIKYKCVFNNVTNNILENLIEKLAKGSIKEQKERALVKLLIFVKKEDIQSLFDLLNKDGNLNNVFKEIQNATFSLFGEQDNQDRLLKVLVNKFKNLKEDSNKWLVINTLIKAKYNDIKDANKKEFIGLLLASMKEYENNREKIGGIVEFFSEMLIDDCKNLTDYKIVFELASLRFENKEAFSSFTQGNRIKLKVPGFIFDIDCSVNDSGLGRKWSWVKPGRFYSYCSNQQTNDFTQAQVDNAFSWAGYLRDNEMAANLYPDKTEELLNIFKTQFSLHIQNTKEVNQNFWSTTDIVCNNLNSILNHININESSTSLKEVDKQTKFSVLEKYFECSNNSISISFEKIDNSILKLLASFDKEDASVLHTLEKIGIDKIHHKLEQDESFKTLAKVYVWMGGQAFNSNHYNKVDLDQILNKDGKIKNYTSVLSLESNMLQFDNFSASIESKTKIKINGTGKSYDYNQMMVLYAADNFKFLDQNFKKGDVLVMPLIQAYAMSKSNRRIVAEKIAWTAVDGVLLFVGVGEFKILFTAGNYIRKAIVASDLIGNAAGILGNVLNESALSPQDRYKLQMLAILASLPQLSTSIKGIDNMVSSLDSKINKLNNVSHRKALNDYFSEVKAKLPAASGLDDFIAILKQKKLFAKYDGLSDSLKKLFKEDFLTASDEVLEALKNEDAFSTWKHFRGINKTNIICN